MRSEKQKQADKRYREKIYSQGKKAKFQAEMNADEAQAINEYCKEHGLNKSEFLRRALALMTASEN